MKTCAKCKAGKELNEFHVNRASPDGRQRRCKACRSVKKIKSSDEMAARVARDKLVRRLARLRRSRRAALNDRSKIRAREKAKRAIREGRIKRLPCEVCRLEPAEAHHDDYSKPLEVRFLCRLHHREFHARKV